MRPVVRQDLVLVVNAGSSSLKLALLAARGIGQGWRAQVERIGGPAFAEIRDGEGVLHLSRAPGTNEGRDHVSALAFLLGELGSRIDLSRIVATGHRIVHGGTRFTGPVRVDAGVDAGIAALEPFAPLHQPHNLSGLRAAMTLLPQAPHVACFDTAFHRTIPESRYSLPLPLSFRENGLRRFGFHGLSYTWIASELPKQLSARRRRNVVVAHLGNGCSLCALKDGASYDTSMGLTPLDGLVMGTRSGSIDPSAIFHLIRREGMDPAALEDLLFRRSGLLGVSGISNDMRTVLASDTAPARLAVELFIAAAARGIAGMAASLGALDAVVFTGGIGERATTVRRDIVSRLAFAGLRLDARANDRSERRISAPRSPVAVLVLPTDEERVIADQTLHTLAAG